METGWIFRRFNANGVKVQFSPPLGVTISHDQGRKVRRTVSGVTLIPDEAEAIDLSQDQVEVIMTRRDDRTDVVTEHRMGIFNFTGSTRNCDAAVNVAGVTSDILHVDLGDNTVRLLRSSEIPRFVPAGTDPTQLAIQILEGAGMKHAIAGSVSALIADTSWQPFTTDSDILEQLDEIGGHRRFWADNDGVIRSVSANIVVTEIIALEDLLPVAKTIAITDNYLSAPNRVVVQDDTAQYPTVGVWDAPSSSPSSAFRRGYVLTQGVSQQWLTGPVHAERIAQTMGEQLSASSLTADILPTWLLDGPRVLSYRNRLWLLSGWSISTDVGSNMSISASEVPLSEGES